MTFQNLPNQKKDALPNKYIGTVLTQSEIRSLRQDLEEAYDTSIQKTIPNLEN